MKKKLKSHTTLDNIFSEIDVKETTINNTDRLRLYSLDILSDNEDSSGSLNLDDYNLDTLSNIYQHPKPMSKPMSKPKSKPKSIHTPHKHTTLSSLNTVDFFNCLLDIDNDPKKNIQYKEQKENEKDHNYKIQYVNELSDLINIVPKKIIVNKLPHAKTPLSISLKTLTSNSTDTNIKQIPTDTDLKQIPTDMDLKQIPTDTDLKQNICDKTNIWKDLKTDNLSSFNYLHTESLNIVNTIDNNKLLHFYKMAGVNKFNIKGVILNNQIIKCKQHTDYEYEVYTKLSNNDIIDPPGNYINMLFKKNLNILRGIYLLTNSGYWILQPLSNFYHLVNKQYCKDVLYVYFIIIKLLYCNKRYPFDSGNCIQKYKILVKTINLNLILNYINNDIQFKNYIDDQLKNVFKINNNIDTIIKIINENNMNKHYSNILNLKYIKY